MIIRLANTLAKKLKETDLSFVPPTSNALTDWTARLFSANRAQYVLVSNTETLYSSIFYGKGVNEGTRFIERMLDSLQYMMNSDNFEAFYDNRILPETGEIVFSKTSSRTITGSMNDMISRSKYYLLEDDLSLFDLSFMLNGTPMSFLKYKTPREAFGVAVQKIYVVK